VFDSSRSPAVTAYPGPVTTRDDTDAEVGDRHGPTPPHTHKLAKKSLPLWQEVIVLLVLALALAVLVKSFFVQAFFVPSVSMEPEFLKGDRILVEKVSYWNDDIHRGDVIVFDDPGGWLGAVESQRASGVLQRGLEAVGLYPTGGHLVKRVIGIGGDRVVCCDKQGRMSVNGVPLDEREYLPAGVRPSDVEFDQRVPRGELWMMGDNRNNSGDSRLHMGDPNGGSVDTEMVVGKVGAIVWPLGRVEKLARPEIFDNPALDGS